MSLLQLDQALPDYATYRQVVVTSPERIQLRRTKGWRKPEGAVSVARGTRWGNPFRVGDQVELDGRTVTVSRELAVALYAGWLVDHFGEEADDHISEALAGRTLMCWCPVGDPCHGDLLLAIANRETLVAKYVPVLPRKWHYRRAK
jgi:hypothetical protein